jgi:type IV secretion system protein VirD4
MNISSIRLNTTEETTDIQLLAREIIDPKWEGLNNHWDKTAYAFLVACITHNLHSEHPVSNLAELHRILLETPLPTQFSAMKESSIESVVKATNDMLNRARTERGSILSTMLAALDSHLSVVPIPA